LTASVSVAGANSIPLNTIIVKPAVQGSRKTQRFKYVKTSQ
jgi:hypothetical protein